MIRFELEPPVRTTCHCCGKPATRLTRFVYDDFGAYGVYFASFAPQHRDVKAIVSIGEWGDGTTPADRAAFAMVLWQNAGNHAVTLVDAADSPWNDVDLLGPVLDRDEALVHPRLEDVYNVTDHMFSDDPEIIGFFAKRAR